MNLTYYYFDRLYIWIHFHYMVLNNLSYIDAKIVRHFVYHKHEIFEDILNSTTIHKMCYFDDKSILEVKDFVKKYLNIKID